MKRIFSAFLILMMLAALAGCGKQGQEPSVPEKPEPPADEAIVLAELNVEFAAGAREMETLLALKKELPPLLISALSEEGVKVGTVNVTFGTSEEATADALSRGTVQVGFLPAETYLEHEDALLAADVSLSPVIVALGTSSSAYGRELEKKADGAFSANLSWDDLKRAVWALPEEDGFVLRWLDAYLDRYYDGRGVDDLPHTIRYASGETLDAESYDLLAAVTEEDAAKDGRIGTWQEIAYFFSTVTAVSKADAILSNETFLTALGNAVGTLSAEETGALYAYDGVRYGPVTQDGVEATFESWRLVYDHEQGQ